MKRRLSFPATITASDGKGPHLLVPLSFGESPSRSRSEHAADMAASIPYNTVRAASSAFASMAGDRRQVPAPYATGDAVVIPLPPAAVAEPWRVAVLLNLVDFSAGNPDPEIMLIKSATVNGPSLAGVTVAACFDDLERRVGHARRIMTSRLPEGFWLDEYEKDQWPESPNEYFFDVNLRLAHPPSASETAEIADLLERLELMIGWMAFATEGTAEEWIDRGWMVYPGGTAVRGATINYSAQRPPSDIAPALLILEQALRASQGIAVHTWGIEIVPAD